METRARPEHGGGAPYTPDRVRSLPNGGAPPSLPQKPPCDLRQHTGPSHGDRLPRGPPVLRSIRESKAELKERR